MPATSVGLCQDRITISGIDKQFAGKRLLLNAEQKRRLAMKGKALGRRLLEQFGTLFSPGTILRWHRMLIARKYDDSANRRPGPPATKANMIRDLVVRMADENPGWGYGRIHGELKGLGFDVHWQTVRRVIREHGFLDDPDRPEKTRWRDFLRSHRESIAACDFFTLEAWTMTGLTRFLVFFVIDLTTRRITTTRGHTKAWATGGSTSPRSLHLRTAPFSAGSVWVAC